MDKNRLWVIGCVLVMGAILALGFVLGIQPQLKSASAAQQERLAVETSNSEQAIVLAQLKEDFADIDEVRQALVPLNVSVPTGTEMPAFVNQLADLAERSRVSLTGITVSEPQAYATVVAPSEAAPTAEVPADGAAPTDAAAVDPVAATPLVTAGVPSVLDSRITAANFASLSVQISITADYNSVLDFINGLQTGSRLFLVSGITTAAVAAEGATPDAPPVAGGPVDATITGLVYVLVPDAASAAVTDAR